MSACHVSSKSRGRVKIGSVSHELIQLCLQHYNIPVRERNYIKSLYSQLNGKIATKNWVSDLFEFLKDIFQGDPYSPTIFLVIFQPLIDYIQLHRETHGYQLGKAKVLTTPFADDFDLITNNCKKHQKLQLDVQRKAESMGLCFKPSKCRSLSIKRGQVDGEHKFFLLTGGGEEVSLKTMEDDPHKFLGSQITNFNSLADHFNFLKSKLEEKLANLDTTLVRGEYKVAVYSRYVLPSLQFHFAVHNIHKTHLDLSDASARKYLAGISKEGRDRPWHLPPQHLGCQVPLSGLLGEPQGQPHQPHALRRSCRQGGGQPSAGKGGSLEEEIVNCCQMSNNLQSDQPDDGHPVQGELPKCPYQKVANEEG